MSDELATWLIPDAIVAYLLNFYSPPLLRVALLNTEKARLMGLAILHSLTRLDCVIKDMDNHSFDPHPFNAYQDFNDVFAGDNTKVIEYLLPRLVRMLGRVFANVENTEYGYTIPRVTVYKYLGFYEFRVMTL